MTLATLSACLPLPYPDASAETLKQLLSESEGTAVLSSSTPRDARGESLTPRYSPVPSAQRMRTRMVSLGPVGRRRRGLFRRGRAKLGVGGDGDGEAMVFSRRTVWRGFTAPRDRQLDALEQVLRLFLSLCGVCAVISMVGFLLFVALCLSVLLALPWGLRISE